MTMRDKKEKTTLEQHEEALIMVALKWNLQGKPQEDYTKIITKLTGVYEGSEEFLRKFAMQIVNDIYRGIRTELGDWGREVLNSIMADMCNAYINEAVAAIPNGGSETDSRKSKKGKLSQHEMMFM